MLKHGNPMEISQKFGGTEKLRGALEQLQAMLYEINQT
jgi:hypothetical protein